VIAAGCAGAAHLGSISVRFGAAGACWMSAARSRSWRRKRRGFPVASTVSSCARCRERGTVEFTRTFEDQAAWLAVHTSKKAVAEPMRIAWRTVGLICERVMTDYLTERWPSHNDVELFNPAAVHTTRYRYRGARIPTPWEQGVIAYRDHPTAMDHLEGLIAR
jgi:hypothetical protein